MQANGILMKWMKTFFQWKKKSEWMDNLENNGERVEINLNQPLDFELLNMYQKSHLKRYEFALSLVNPSDHCADLACGTAYGSVMLASKSKLVTAVDKDASVIATVKKRYSQVQNLCFHSQNLLTWEPETNFDKIISFETLEHFKEWEIEMLMKKFSEALTPGGKLLFSTPYRQKADETALKLGHHLTFGIDEEKIFGWLKQSEFVFDFILYQNYLTHHIEPDLEIKDFIICCASKPE